MYKSSLQEYCQSKKWKLPEYKTGRQGQDHCPLFAATVTVNGSVFSTPQSFKSSKEAQNFAAKIAFDHFTGISSEDASQVAFKTVDPQKPIVNQPLNASSSTGLNLGNKDDKVVKGTSSADASQAAVNTVDPQKPIVNQPLNASSSTGVYLGNKDDKVVKDMSHLYKNQLQTYAQKRNLTLPMYHYKREGPPHAPRFKSWVLLDGRTYQSNEYFSTLKDAENDAAKAALMSLSCDRTEEEDSGFYKNLLQELAQREYSCLPVYNTIRSGPSHLSVFVSTVKVHEASFTGQEAKTKKLAESHAAKVAYLALKDRNNGSSGCHVDDSSPKLHLDAAELADGHISEQNPVSDAIKELVKCNEGVDGQDSEVKLTETCPSEGKVQEPEMDFIPFLEDDSPNPRSDANSSRKRIKVFPATLNMRVPEGAVLMRKDDKWVAVKMDSS